MLSNMGQKYESFWIIFANLLSSEWSKQPNLQMLQLWFIATVTTQRWPNTRAQLSILALIASEHSYLIVVKREIVVASTDLILLSAEKAIDEVGCRSPRTSKIPLGCLKQFINACNTSLNASVVYERQLHGWKISPISMVEAILMSAMDFMTKIWWVPKRAK